MSAEDWHGACHAAGMSGLCGEDCPALHDGDCGIADEICEECNLDEDFEPIINRQRNLF